MAGQDLKSWTLPLESPHLKLRQNVWADPEAESSRATDAVGGNVSNTETDDFFNDGVREGSPSAKFKEVGDSVKGEVVDKYMIDYVPFGKKDPEIDERTGQVVKQLAIVLQTDLRDWEGVSKVPVDADGNKLDGSKDTGKRAIYCRKGTNIYSALAKSISAALPAGEKPGAHPKVGGKFGVQFFEEEDTGKGNPLKKFRAKYEAPAAAPKGDEWFDEGASAGGDEPKQDKVADEVKAAKASVADDEPPF